MVTKIKIFFAFWAILFAVNMNLSAQNLIQDAPAQKTSVAALKHIYNWEFVLADQKIESLKATYVKHPAYYLLKALMMHWQYMPIEKSHPKFIIYEQLLNRSAQLAEARLKKDKRELEGIFFKLMAYGLKAVAEVETGSKRRAVGYARRAYSAMKRGFKLHDQFSEFYFSTGMYRYYAKQLPQIKPILKPFMIFFPAGNKAIGIQHMRTATQKASFTRNEAKVFLADIYLKYEANIYEASLLFANLQQTFPKNPLFALKYAECLVHLGRYYEAQNYFAKFQTHNAPIYQIGTLALQGLIAERLQKNEVTAKKYYTKLLNIKGYDQRYSRDYRALAKVGLARMLAKKLDKTSRKTAKNLYKQARKHTEYEWLKREIKKAMRQIK